MSGKAGVEDGFAALAGADADREALGGLAHPKVVNQVHIHERRYVKDLAAGLPELVGFGLDGGDVGVALAERVVDFVDDRGEFSVAPVAVIDADRIETVTERSRHAEQLNGAARNVDSRFRQNPFGLIA